MKKTKINRGENSVRRHCGNTASTNCTHTHIAHMNIQQNSLLVKCDSFEFRMRKRQQTKNAHTHIHIEEDEDEKLIHFLNVMNIFDECHSRCGCFFFFLLLPLASLLSQRMILLKNSPLCSRFFYWCCPLLLSIFVELTWKKSACNRKWV